MVLSETYTEFITAMRKGNKDIAQLTLLSILEVLVDIRAGMVRKGG